MRKIIAIVLLFCVISSQVEDAAADAFDCYDACSTACVQPDGRLMLRCDRKCQIKCGPDSEIKGNTG